MRDENGLLPSEKMALSFSEEQVNFIVRQAKEGRDIMWITRQIFNDEKLSGRDTEGRAVRLILTQQDVKYKSSKFEKLGDELQTLEKAFIKNNYSSARNAFELARTLWPNDMTLKPTDRKVILIQEYVAIFDPLAFREKFEEEGDYSPPGTFKKCLKLISEATNQDLDEEKVSNIQRRNTEKILTYLKSPRFLMTIRCYSLQEEKKLFEHEFVRTTWDKPDLTADEINLCINLCQEYIQQMRFMKNAQKLQMQLDSIMDQNDESRKIQVSLTEAITENNNAHNKQVERQQKINNDLNGSRKKRMEQKQQSNQSIAAIVEYFQEEDNRKKLAKYAQLYKKEFSEEVSRFEKMEDMHAKIFGVDADDLR